MKSDPDFLEFKSVFKHLQPKLNLIGWSLEDFYDSLQEFEIDYFEEERWTYPLTVWRVTNALELILENPESFE
jgi:hypothetical protein